MSGRGGPDAPVLVVAGATGTGKSTVCRWLGERGAFVIEADRVGHEILLDAAIRERIAAVFGPEALDSEGHVDRAALGRKVFANADELAKLNAIVHPPLVAEVERRIARLRRSRAVTLIVVDAALHFQFDPPLPCDAVLMTTADPREARRRIVERDGLSPEQAQARLDRQEAVSASLSRADAVLDTFRPPAEVRDELLARVDELLDLRLAESDPPAALRAPGEA
jgi:dephospho-CoA kinase